MNLAEAKTESIGHLGLVASTLQEHGVMDKINAQLGEVANGLGHGQRVGAMVLNGLGFANTALYMTPHFFHDKPLSLLLGKGIKASQLNDDCLGRCLDRIAAYGTTKWYSELAFSVVESAGLLCRSAHIDSTTLSLYGAYETEVDESVEPTPLLGYSKDHRPDLKQVTLQCVSLGKQALPVWMEARNGNSSDKKSFSETVQRVDAFCQQLEAAPKMCFIGDSALYSEKLAELDVDWLTRVPETYAEAKTLCALEEVNWGQTADKRYQCIPYQPVDKKERWLLIRSEPAYKREVATLIRKHARIFNELEKALWHCSCQVFSCEADAIKAADKIIAFKKHFYNVDYRIICQKKFNAKGRPKREQEPDALVYKVEIMGLSTDYIKFQGKRDTLGRFILATNVMDKEALPDEAMLVDYKEQQGIERGFRFIKNDMIGLDSIYLKNPERIGALMAIMTLCLLIYGLTQYRLREALSLHEESLPDRKGKPTQTPTLMWVFTLFSSITLINIPDDAGIPARAVMNLEPLHRKIILLLGGAAKKIYLLPEKLRLDQVNLNQKTWLKWCGM